MSIVSALRRWAGSLKRDVMTVYFAARDPRTPFPIRALAVAVAAYALSPIDLIPDFIPVLGYLDDLLIVPLGLYVVIRLLPPDVLNVSRQKALAVSQRPRSPAAFSAARSPKPRVSVVKSLPRWENSASTSSPSRRAHPNAASAWSSMPASAKMPSELCTVLHFLDCHMAI